MSAATRRPAAPARSWSTASRSSRAPSSASRPTVPRSPRSRVSPETASSIRSSRRSTSSTRCSAASVPPGWSCRSSASWTRTPRRASRRSARRSRATFAAAPATRTSSRPSRPPRGCEVAAIEARGWIGQSVPRKEDRALLTGRGTFVDNMTLPGTVYMALVRSPYAHARITSVDTSKATAAEGVVAAFSGAELADDWKASLPTAWLPTEDTAAPLHRPPATDKARYVGDAVAVVVAESRAAAKDAAELVEVGYEPLDAVIDPEAALAEGAPGVHDELDTNRCYTWELDAGDIDKAFADAAVTVSCRFRQNRLIPNALEPRAYLAQPVGDELTLWSSTQVPHILRIMATVVLGIPETKIRVVAPDVGGGFGSKLDVYAEEMLVLTLARRLGRPVKWAEERSEGYLATIHGRDVWQEIELAATAEGKVTAGRARLTAAMGAYLQLVTAGVPLLGAWLYAGAYDVDAYSLHCTGVFTNTTPTVAY